MSRLLAVSALTLALVATAEAKVRWFHSPSGNIQCEVAYHDSRGSYAYCQTFHPAESATLHLNGRTKLCHGGKCLGDGPENAFTLAYGHSVTVGEFKCTSSTDGMRCAVGKHGFTISKRGIGTY